jgi:hypothetical protein
VAAAISSAIRGLLLIVVGLAGLQAQAPASRTRILLDEAHHNLFQLAADASYSFSAVTCCTSQRRDTVRV